jgi:hypothetical protein
MFSYNQFNAMVSIYYKQFSANSTTQLNWIDLKSRYETTLLALSYRLNHGFAIRSSAQYNISDNNLMSCKGVVEKSFPRGYLSFSYERNLLFDDHFMGLNFKYDLSFARTNASVSHNNGYTYTSESAQGSLAFGGANGYVHKSNNASLAKGGILLYPFLDLNCNGVFDKGEHMVKLTSVKVMGGKAIYCEKDSIVRIPDLNAFTDCVIDFDNTDLDDIAWRFKYKRYQVLVDPNQFKRVDVPIISVGEIRGTANIDFGKGARGIGRIQLNLYPRNNSNVVSEILSESDGYIDYIGLEPGEYTARVDSAQLKNMDFSVSPKNIDFTVKSLVEGDIVSDINFMLKPMEYAEVRNSDTLIKPDLLEDVKIIKSITQNNASIPDSTLMTRRVNDTTINFVKEQPNIQNKGNQLVWGTMCAQKGYYYVQCGAFKDIRNATNLAESIKQNTDLSVGVVLFDGLYKVQVECVSTIKEATEIKNKLSEKSISDDMFIMGRSSKDEAVLKSEKDSTGNADELLPVDKKGYQLVWGIKCNKDGNYFVECGMFKNKKNAMRLAQNMKRKVNADVGVVRYKEFYRVHVGCVATSDEAYKIRDILMKKCLDDNFYSD